MKTIIYTLLILSSVAFSYSCSDKDEETKFKFKTEIPSGWIENGDLEILGKRSWFLHRSGNDSIKLNIHYYSTINNNIYITFYQKGQGGRYAYKGSEKLEDAYSIEKGMSTQMLGLWGKEDYGIDYKKTSDTYFIVYNLPNMGAFAEGKKFEAVSNKLWTERSILAGGWYNVGVVDSTVLAFEGDYLKEYLFVRTSSNLIDSWDYGKYSSVLEESWLGKELLASTRTLSFTDSDIANCSYAFNADQTKLTIYWKSPGKTMTYTRIKN